MADTRLTELVDLGANAVAGDYLLIHDLSDSYDKYINVDDFFTSLWALNQAFTTGAAITLGASLIGGAQTISGTAFDIDGGDISSVTISGGLTWSAAQNMNSQALTNINIDSGAIDGVTLGINSAITEAQIDNININGNTIISSDANGDINLTPNGTGEVVISKVDINDGAIDSVDIGGATPATGAFTTLSASGIASFADGSAGSPSITNTGDTDTGFYFNAANAMTFTSGGVSQVSFRDGVIIPFTDNDIDLGDATHEFKDIYSDGTIYADDISGSGTSTLVTVDNDIITIGKTLSFDGTPQELTGAGEINATTGVTQIRTGAGALAATIANGTTDGQIKQIYMTSDGGGDAALNDSVLNATSIVFGNEGEGCTLIWDNTNTKWNVVGCSATFTA